MIQHGTPALVLAPMDGITDAPMRSLQGATGAFSYGITEFIRVSSEALPTKVFRREVPELAFGAKTPDGMPVQVQILGGDPERMAISASRAVSAGAKAIDINFGCPAPTVNRNDGGASLLKHPERIELIVRAVREALPSEIPVSAKLRLGWDGIEAIYENAARAAAGGASWLTIHARTRTQGYQPPVYWKPIGEVRASLSVPVIANGDIWTLDDFRRCQDMTGCEHFMLGRSALADPALPYEVRRELGLSDAGDFDGDWERLLRELVRWSEHYIGVTPRSVLRIKQWLSLANRHGSFHAFDAVKRTTTIEECFAALRNYLAQ